METQLIAVGIWALAAIALAALIVRHCCRCKERSDAKPEARTPSGQQFEAPSVHRGRGPGRPAGSQWDKYLDGTLHEIKSGIEFGNRSLEWVRSSVLKHGRKRGIKVRTTFDGCSLFVLAGGEPVKNLAAQRRAARWLRALMSNRGGLVLAAKVYADADAAGISRDNLRSAFTELNVETIEKPNGGDLLALPVAARA